MDLDADDLDGYNRTNVYEDGKVVRTSIRRTSDSTYPSGWRYTFHYGSLTPDEGTLEDGTIRRYDNAHEDTKGHEFHIAPTLNQRSSTSLVSRNCIDGSGMRFQSQNSGQLIGEDSDRE